MEPLNKGHLHTECIVPYSEVVPYWEVFQRILNNDVKSPLNNRELISGALFQYKHYSRLLACELIITALKKTRELQCQASALYIA